MRKPAVIFLALLATPCIASNTIKEKKPFEAEAEVGALATSGNTKSTAFKGKLDITHDLLNWRNNYSIEGMYKENEVEIEDSTSGDIYTENQTTQEKYFISGQAKYKLNEEYRGLFIFGSYEKDKFSGYDYQGTFASGYSNRLFETDTTYLDYNFGPGVTYSKEGESEENPNPERESNVVIRIAGNFLWQISENAKFTQSFSSNIATNSDKNTKTKAETAITATINGSFALRTAFSVDNNSQVQDEKEKTDTQTSVTLVYTY